MKRRLVSYRPTCEPLESRLALSHGAALGGFELAGTAAPPEAASPVGAALRGGTASLADLQVMARAYLSRVGDTNYNPAVDLNRDGKVNQYDARLLEKELPKPPPGTPLKLTLRLEPGQQVLHPRATYNSGATARRLKQVTVIGHTIPGALVFADSSQGLYNFDGPLLPTDASGRFTYTRKLKDKLTASLSFLVIDQFGRQLVRNYPIFRV